MPPTPVMSTGLPLSPKLIKCWESKDRGILSLSLYPSPQRGTEVQHKRAKEHNSTRAQIHKSIQHQTKHTEHTEQTVYNTLCSSFKSPSCLSKPKYFPLKSFQVFLLLLPGNVRRLIHPGRDGRGRDRG